MLRQTPQSISRNTLQRLKEGDPKLYTLHIGTYNVMFDMELHLRPEAGGVVPNDKSDLIELGQLIANSHALKRLEIMDEYLNSFGSIEQLIRGIKQNSSICELYLAKCSLGTGCGRRIVEAFRSKGSLNIFGLSNCNFD